MNLGFPEMLFLGLLALLLFGPRRLPEIGRQIGKALGEFKRASSEFQNQLEDEVRQLEVQEDGQRSIAPPAPEGSIAQTTAAGATASSGASPESSPESSHDSSPALSSSTDPPLPASSSHSSSGQASSGQGDPGGNGAQSA